MMASLRIAEESELTATNYEQPPQFTWKEYYDFRNHVVCVLRQYGSVGPTGLIDLRASEDDDLVFEHGDSDDPDYFVVDDMYNEHDRITLVESDTRHISVALIEALVGNGEAFPGWRVQLSLGDAGLHVFGDKVVAAGRRFWDCTSVDEVAARCAAPVDFGAPPPFSQAMYAIWVAIISGEFHTSDLDHKPQDRQWREAIRAMEQLRRLRPGSPLNPFDYARIRFDLHPQTRAEHVRKFLDEIGSHPQGRVKEAKRNIEKDAGHALATLRLQDDRASLAKSISSAQKLAATWLDPNEVVFFWPYVLDAADNPDESLRSVLMRELRTVLTDSNEWIQLSVVFTLALLRVDDIAGIVKAALKANPAWSASEPLKRWLDDLRDGSTSYPSGLNI
jgi:hypothetical protein